MPVGFMPSEQIFYSVLTSQLSFHPDFHDRNSPIQREMMQYMQKWVQGLGPKQHEILGRLSKDAVRNHRNIRLAGEGGPPAVEGSFAVNAAHQTQHDLQGYVNQIPVVGSAVQFAQGLQGASGHNQPPTGHGFGGPSQTPGGGLLGSVPGLGKLGEAQAFLGQFSGGQGGRKDVPQPGYPSYTPSQPPSIPTSPHSYPPSGPPGGGPPGFPGGPPAPSPYGGSSYPNPPGGQGGYAPSYGPPEPQTGYSSYGGSYAPPPGGPPSFPGGPGYPGGESSYPGSGSGYPGGPGGMPDANPTGGFGMPNANPPGPPSFPGANPYGGFGYNDAPNRPW